MLRKGHRDRSKRRGRARAHCSTPRADPVQLPGISDLGARFVDYINAGEYVVPKYYAESVARLPDCFQANDDTRAAAYRAVFDVWMRLLRRVTESGLWLYADEELGRRNLRATAPKRGVAHDRLFFAPWLRYPDHPARLGLAYLSSRHRSPECRRHVQRRAPQRGAGAYVFR